MCESRRLVKSLRTDCASLETGIGGADLCLRLFLQDNDEERIP
jgi:hypothetical protein